jgi:hypothetical protein
MRSAEMDGEIGWAIALYLAEKAKNGPPRYREIAETSEEIPHFQSPNSFLLPRS